MIKNPNIPFLCDSPVWTGEIERDARGVVIAIGTVLGLGSMEHRKMWANEIIKYYSRVESADDLRYFLNEMVQGFVEYRQARLDGGPSNLEIEQFFVNENNKGEK